MLGRACSRSRVCCWETHAETQLAEAMVAEAANRSCRQPALAHPWQGWDRMQHTLGKQGKEKEQQELELYSP